MGSTHSLAHQLCSLIAVQRIVACVIAVFHHPLLFQAAVRSGLHSDASVLGFMFYSNAAEARRFEHKFHLMLVYICQLHTEYFH